MDVGQLTDILLQKNNDLVELMCVARQQQELQQKIEKIRAEILVQDQVWLFLFLFICVFIHFSVTHSKTFFYRP